jgi:hypothetical protein
MPNDTPQTNQDTSQIEGLPPGAVLRPIGSQNADASKIEGLPPGAILKPIRQPVVVNGIDLSAGLVPKDSSHTDPSKIEGLPPGAILKPMPVMANGIDLSAGLVPKTQMVTNSAGETMPADVAARHARANEHRNQVQADEAAKQAASKAALANSPYAGIAKVGDTVSDIAHGAFKEAGKTTMGLENLVSGGAAGRSSWAPDPEELQTHGVAENIGGLAEQGLEWATGEEILGGLGKLAKLEKLAQSSPTVAKMLKDSPQLVQKIVGATVKSGVIGAAQGGVKESAPGGSGFTSGAEAGGAGGAIGGAAGELLGGTVRGIGKAFGVGASDVDNAMRALQPGKTNRSFINDWNIAKDRLAQEVESGGKFKSLGDAADRVQDVRQNLWNDEIKPALDKHATESFDTNPVAKAVRDKITPTLEKNFPEDAKQLRSFADKYQSGTPLFAGDKSVADVESEIELYNAKLSDKGYWKKSPSERAAMEKANPEIAAWKTASDAMREGLYDHLSKAGEQGIGDLKKTYGALSNIENLVRGRVNVVGRQQPISLKQIIGLVAGAAHGGPAGVAVASIPLVDKYVNSPENLLGRAVSKSQPTTGAVKQAVKSTAQAVGRNAGAIGGFAGEQGVLMMTPDGQPVSVHPEDAEAAANRGFKYVESQPQKQ